MNRAVSAPQSGVSSSPLGALWLSPPESETSSTCYETIHFSGFPHQIGGRLVSPDAHTRSGSETARWMDGQIDGWMGGESGKWTDGHTDGETGGWWMDEDMNE